MLFCARRTMRILPLLLMPLAGCATKGTGSLASLTEYPNPPPIPASVQPAPRPLLSESVASDLKRWHEMLTDARVSDGR